MKIDVRSDWPIVWALLVAGSVGLAIGYLTHRAPLTMLPGMDGAVTTVSLGFLLLLLHGIAFRRALVVIAPMVLLLLGLSWQHRLSPPAVVGLEAVLFGVFGGVATILRGDPSVASNEKPVN